MKNLKLKLTFLSLCAFATAAHAQQVKGNSVLYTSSQGNMRIEMCSESMFRVTKVPAQQISKSFKQLIHKTGRSLSLATLALTIAFALCTNVIA